MKKFYAILNSAVIFAVVFWNYLSNTGVIGNSTVGEISAKYDNLFTPSGYAFAIWGVIFLALIVLGIAQVIWAFSNHRHSETITQIGPWLTLANLGNALWLYVWLNEYTGFSVLVMLFILVSLIMIILRLNMERWDAPFPIISAVWWPICLYSGWISVASIANVSAWLAKLEWSFAFSEITWTLLMISIAGLLHLFMIATRNMREFALVGVWALLAIAHRHADAYEAIYYTATIWSLILILAISLHAFLQRKTLPFIGHLFKR